MYRGALLILGMGLCAAAHGAEDGLLRGHWRQGGHDFANSRNQPAEVLINSRNVHALSVKWVFTTGGNVSATPTVSGDAVFFPDSAGNLYAVNRHNGQLIWSHQIADYNGVAGSISRNS